MNWRWKIENQKTKFYGLARLFWHLIFLLLCQTSDRNRMALLFLASFPDWQLPSIQMRMSAQKRDFGFLESNGILNIFCACALIFRDSSPHKMNSSIDALLVNCIIAKNMTFPFPIGHVSIRPSQFAPVH